MAVRLPDMWIDELKSRLDIANVVSTYIDLKPKGRRFWASCPFHTDKTPSFSVDPDRQMYYCYSCHKGGSVINFIMEMEHTEFFETCEMLAERVGMQAPEAGPRNDQMSRAEYTKMRDRIYEANRLAARYYHDLLKTDEGAKALSYLYKRGLTDAKIKHFGLGAAPDDRTRIKSYLNQLGYEDDILVKAGLLVSRDGKTYDMFRDRAMFPIISAQGQVLGFGGRAFGDAQPKYLNTSDTPVFNKRKGLYSINFAKSESSEGRFVLVEGYMDTVSLRANGVKGVVATLGTALTQEQARLIRRYVKEVWISYDGDPPGQKAALRAIDILTSEDINVRVIDYPNDMDPDDFIKAKGLEGFNNLKRFTGIEYKLARARDGKDLNLAEQLQAYTLEACKILGEVKSPIELDDYVKKLSKETGYDKEVLLKQIDVNFADSLKEAKPKIQIKRNAEEKDDETEKTLIYLLSRGYIDGELLDKLLFDDPIYSAVYSQILNGKSFDHVLLNMEEGTYEREKLLKALNAKVEVADAETAKVIALDCVKRKKEQQTQKRIAELEELISSQTDNEKRRELTNELAHLYELL